MGPISIKTINQILAIIKGIIKMTIDLHTHILPQLDDGAATLEESLAMTAILDKQKIKVAVCTPHYNPANISMADFLKKRKNAFEQMGDSKIKLILGCEVLLHEYLFHYSDLSKLCIGSTPYILLELNDMKKWDKETEASIKKIIHYYNLIPILAHIERYPVMMKKKIVTRLKDMGCLFQINTHSILNKKTKKQVLSYMKAGYIDVLGSDCHNTSSRQPIIDRAIKELVKHMGEEYLAQLNRNAECIIMGDVRRKVSIYILK